MLVSTALHRVEISSPDIAIYFNKVISLSTQNNVTQFATCYNSMNVRVRCGRGGRHQDLHCWADVDKVASPPPHHTVLWRWGLLGHLGHNIQRRCLLALGFKPAVTVGGARKYVMTKLRSPTPGPAVVSRAPPAASWAGRCRGSAAP